MSEVLPVVSKETYERGLSGNVMKKKSVSVSAVTAKEAKEIFDKVWEGKDE